MMTELESINIKEFTDKIQAISETVVDVLPDNISSIEVMSVMANIQSHTLLSMYEDAKKMKGSREAYDYAMGAASTTNTCLLELVRLGIVAIDTKDDNR